MQATKPPTRGINKFSATFSFCPRNGNVARRRIIIIPTVRRIIIISKSRILLRGIIIISESLLINVLTSFFKDFSENVSVKSQPRKNIIKKYNTFFLIWDKKRFDKRNIIDNLFQ